MKRLDLMLTSYHGSIMKDSSIETWYIPSKSFADFTAQVVNSVLQKNWGWAFKEMIHNQFGPFESCRSDMEIHGVQTRSAKQCFLAATSIGLHTFCRFSNKDVQGTPEKLGVHSLTAQARLVMTSGILGFEWAPFRMFLPACDVWQVSFQDLPITFGRTTERLHKKGAEIPVKFGNAKSEMDQWGLTWNACNSCHRIDHSNTGAVICRFLPQAC